MARSIEELDLFGSGDAEPEPLPPIAEKLWGACDVKWTAWRGAHRPCDYCTKRIHEMGTAAAPFPRAATKRRKGPNDDRYLCPEDAELQKRLDDAAEAERKRRLADDSPQSAEERRKWAMRRKPREGMS